MNCSQCGRDYGFLGREVDRLESDNARMREAIEFIWKEVYQFDGYDEAKDRILAKMEALAPPSKEKI